MSCPHAPSKIAHVQKHVSGILVNLSFKGNTLSLTSLAVVTAAAAHTWKPPTNISSVWNVDGPDEIICL